MYALSVLPICFAGMVPISDLTMTAESSVKCNYLADYVLKTDDGLWWYANSLVLITIRSQDTTMVNWENFYEYVMPSVQGCPVSMVQSAIRSACIEFCEKTLIWKQDSIKNDILEGLDLYTFAPPLSAKVVMPYRITIKDEDTNNEKEIEQIALNTLESFDPHWRERTSRIPDYYVLVTDDTVRFIGTPTEDLLESLTACVALKPSRSAKQCPTFIYNDWAETIAAGALAKLHAMKQKDWAIPDLVSYYDRVFKAGISRARSKSEKSWLKESKNMLPIKFYNGKGYY